MIRENFVGSLPFCRRMDRQEGFFDVKDSASKVETPELSTARMAVREKILEHIWTSHIGVVIGIINLIHTKADLSHAVSVSDKVGGWNQNKAGPQNERTWTEERMLDTCSLALGSAFTSPISEIHSPRCFLFAAWRRRGLEALGGVSGGGRI